MLTGSPLENVERLYRKVFDANQRRAVDAILDRWNASGDEEFVFPIVDGPPGTGKTSVGTVAAAKYLLENRRGKIVYLCYTNFAAANAQEKLYEIGLSENQVIRLHSNPKVKDWASGVVGCTSDLTNLSHNEQRRLGNCRVVLCTLHGSRRALRIRGGRPRIIIDEFSQVSPSMFFATLRRVRTEKRFADGYALLGDPKQLPIISTQPLLKPNIGLFIMRRKSYQPHELKVQHRMHRDICEAVNSLRSALNAYPIETPKNVQDRDLEDPFFGFSWDEQAVSDEELRDIVDPQYPLVIVDTDGLGGTEKRTFGGSIKNVAEAGLAVEIAKAIYNSYKTDNGKHLKPMILSPYSAQVGEIRRQLFNERGLKKSCTTIYRAQGREYPCVILSFVRNNPQGFIGFLAEPSLRAQTYVACSRAQGKLIVLLSRQTFVGHGHLDFEYLDGTKSAHKVEVSSR